MNNSARATWSPIEHLTGICNDLLNPLMGSSGMPFNRNMQFEATFPRLGLTELTRNRHGDRLDLLSPDPQLISRKLFTREQTPGNGCNDGMGAADFSPDANCDYLKAPFFNVLAAFWIQFMTHDWFSHTFEGRNAPELQSVGCNSDEARALGCREGDRREPSLFLASEGSGHLRTRRQTSPETSDQNHRQPGLGLVGCLADLRSRRPVAETRPA